MNISNKYKQRTNVLYYQRQRDQNEIETRINGRSARILYAFLLLSVTLRLVWTILVYYHCWDIERGSYGRACGITYQVRILYRACGKCGNRRACNVIYRQRMFVKYTHYKYTSKFNVKYRYIYIVVNEIRRRGENVPRR